MANKTITTNKTISEVISSGLLSGDNIDINSGAILTVDVSPSALIGQIKINDGKMLLDGANATNPIIYCGESAEEINVNGAGILESTLGWYIFSGTSDGTSTYSLNVSNYFSDDPNSNIDSDIFTGMWVETGRRINYDNATGMTPEVGDWLFKSTDHSVMGRVHSVGVNYLVVEDLTGSLSDNDAIELHTIQDNQGSEYQKSWTANVNNTSGDILELDVWTKWANTFQNNADRMSLVGNGNDGRVFLNVHGTNSVTFGDGTAGRIPPSGCRFKVPMVHFCSSTTTLYSTNDTDPASGSGTPYNIELALGGDVILKGVSLGTAVFIDSGASSFYAEYCAASIGFGSAKCGSKVIIKDTIVIGSLFSTTASIRRYIFDTVDLVNGADIIDCAVYILFPTSTETGHLGSETSKDISFTRCITVNGTADEENTFLTVKGVTLCDIEYYGSSLLLRTSSSIDAKLLKFQAVMGSVARSTKPMVSMSVGSSDIKIIGVEILNNSVTTSYIFNISDANNIKIRGMHFIEDPIDMQGFGGVFLRTIGLSSNISMARCHRTNSDVNEIFTGSPVTSNVEVIDCRNDYGGEIDPKGTNIRFIGVGGGSGNLGGTTGIETDYIGCFGNNAAQIFRSDTSGALTFTFMPDSSEFPFIDIVGNPKFTKDGDFDVVNGDSFTIVTDKYYGITGFTGVYTASRSSGTISDGTDEWGANLTIEMQYDDGTGYNGVWLNVKTPSDLTSIPDLSTGVIFKVRVSATGNRINLNGLMIHFNTTIQAQKDNLYPIDLISYQLSLTGLQPLTEVRVYRKDTMEEISGVENSSTTFSAQLVYVGELIIIIHSELYEYQRIEVTTFGDDISLPIQQRFDRNYKNPV